MTMFHLLQHYPNFKIISPGIYLETPNKTSFAMLGNDTSCIVSAITLQGVHKMSSQTRLVFVLVL